MYRRTFLKTTTLASLSSMAKPALASNGEDGKIRPALCLNAYSFNRLLRNGEMSLAELFHFAAETGFRGVDLTAYYIPGYPDVPEDKVLFGIKKMAFRYGITITGTGVRNDFTLADPSARAKEIEHVKNWVVAAGKLGAPHVRMFDGREKPDTPSHEQIKSWVIEAFRECAGFAASQGVMVTYQNHNDFITETGEIIEIMQAVKSEWFGLMLDIGSIQSDNPYADIEKLISYAVTWQVKENVKTANGEEPTDFGKLVKIVHEHKYRGYFPLETLGEGDPHAKVRKLYKQVAENLV
jgi:sugar phosphate isomerase/epimerase